MTAISDQLPDIPNDPGPAPGDATDVAATLVPVAVWRLDDRDDDQATTEPGAGFAARLARRLILVYTRRGDAVVAFDDDPHLHNAAEVAGRSYLAITDTADLADLDEIDQPVTLVMWRWPRDATLAAAGAVADLFTACRLMASRSACVIAAVRPDPPTDTLAGHQRMLRTAARAAGFAHVLHIAALSVPGEGDQFIYHATEPETTQVSGQIDALGPTLHIDLLLFTRQDAR